MIVLYSAVLFLFTIALFLIRRRVAVLERKHSRLAREADEVLKQPVPKENNGAKTDPYVLAKRQYLLGLLAQKRDRAEVRYAAWQEFAEKFQARVTAMRNWKGKKLPYTFGVLDVAGLFYLLDTLGLGQYANVRHLVQMLTNLLFG